MNMNMNGMNPNMMMNNMMMMNNNGMDMNMMNMNNNMGGANMMNMMNMNMPGMNTMMMNNMPGVNPMMMNNMPGVNPMMMNNMPGVNTMMMNMNMNMQGMNMNMPGMQGTNTNTTVNIEDAGGWNLIFENQNDRQSFNIRISEQKYVKEAISLYYLKSNKTEKCKFIFNNKELFPEMKICQSGLTNMAKILVISIQNLKGAN